MILFLHANVRTRSLFLGTVNFKLAVLIYALLFSYSNYINDRSIAVISIDMLSKIKYIVMIINFIFYEFCYQQKLFQ